MNSKYPGATVTVARENPQSLALNDSPSNHLVEILEHKHLTMKFDIVGIHCRTSFKIYPNQLDSYLITLQDSHTFRSFLNGCCKPFDFLTGIMDSGDQKKLLSVSSYY